MKYPPPPKKKKKKSKPPVARRYSKYTYVTFLSILDSWMTVFAHHCIKTLTKNTARLSETKNKINKPNENKLDIIFTQRCPYFCGVSGSTFFGGGGSKFYIRVVSYFLWVRPEKNRGSGTAGHWKKCAPS